MNELTVPMNLQGHVINPFVGIILNIYSHTDKLNYYCSGMIWDVDQTIIDKKIVDDIALPSSTSTITICYIWIKGSHVINHRQWSIFKLLLEI